MVEVSNKDKPFYPRDKSEGVDNFVQIDDTGIVSIIIPQENLNVISEIYDYFMEGKLPKPVEEYKYRLPEYFEPRIIGFGGDVRYLLTSFGRGKAIPGPDVEFGSVTFGILEHYHGTNPELVEFDLTSEIPPISGVMSWSFNNGLSFESNSAIFMTEISPEEEGNKQSQRMFDQFHERGQQRALEDPPGFPL